MFGPAQKVRVHPGFAKALDLLEVDKNNILGLPGSRSGPKILLLLYFPFERHITGLCWQIRVSIHLLSKILFSCFRMLFRI